MTTNRPKVQRYDGGPAFPDSEGQVDYTGGMTLRDYFAAKAMQGALANPEVKESAAGRSEWAYEIADAMLKAREVDNDNQ